MKKLAVFIGFFAIMMFVGCGKSEKSDSDGDNIRNDSDSTETSDFDSEEPDSGDHQSDGDTGDSQPDLTVRTEDLLVAKAEETEEDLTAARLSLR